MKFYCDSCQAKYSIPDEKVRGKVLKVRCKKCSHIITVREPRSPAGGARPEASGGSGAPPPTPTPPQQPVQWYYSVNGQSFGPVTQEQLEQQFGSGELGDATYVWNDTFSDWKPAGEVAVFAAAVRRGARHRPRQNTMGVSQALEAVKRPEGNQQSTAAAPKKEEVAYPGGQRHKAPVETESDEVATSSSSESEPEARQSGSRLEELRQRLNRGAANATEPAQGPQRREEPTSTDDEDDAAARQPEQSPVQKKSADPREASKPKSNLEALRSKLRDGDRKAEPGDEEQPDAVARQQLEEPPSEEQKEDADDVPESWQADETVPLETSPHQEEEQPQPDEEEVIEEPSADPGLPDEPVHDGLFSGLDDDSVEGPAVTPEAEQPSSQPSTEDQQAEEDAEDAVPFFPSSAPKLGDETEESASMSRVGEMTDSLLIQIDEIKSDGRKRAVVATVGGLAAIAAVAAVVVLAWTDLGSGEEEVEQDDGPRVADVGQRPEFHGYSEEELAAVSDRVVLDQQIEITEEDSKAAYEREEAAEAAGGAEPGGGAAGGGDDSGAVGGDLPDTPSIDPDALQREDSDGEPAGAPGQEAGTDGPRFARPGQQDGGGGLSEEDLAALEDMDREDFDSDQFEAMAAVQTDSERGIYQGDENFDPSEFELQEGLTNEQISQGFDRIVESVGSCRQRHVNRGGSFDVRTISVSLTVVPDGDVAQFNLEPSSLEDTDFMRCMDSHTGRWRFPRFKGDPVEIESSFALQ